MTKTNTFWFLLMLTITGFLFFATQFALAHGNQSHSKLGNGNNINNCNPSLKCEPKVVYKTRYKNKVVEKKVEVVVEKEVRKAVTSVNLLGGYGPLGNIKEFTGGAETEQGLVLGLQLHHVHKNGVSGSFQVQTNKTFLFGFGFSVP